MTILCQQCLFAMFIFYSLAAMDKFYLRKTVLLKFMGLKWNLYPVCKFGYAGKSYKVPFNS